VSWHTFQKSENISSIRRSGNNVIEVTSRKTVEDYQRNEKSMKKSTY